MKLLNSIKTYHILVLFSLLLTNMSVFGQVLYEDDWWQGCDIGFCALCGECLDYCGGDCEAVAGGDPCAQYNCCDCYDKGCPSCEDDWWQGCTIGFCALCSKCIDECGGDCAVDVGGDPCAQYNCCDCFDNGCPSCDPCYDAMCFICCDSDPDCEFCQVVDEEETDPEDNPCNYYSCCDCGECCECNPDCCEDEDTSICPCCQSTTHENCCVTCQLWGEHDVAQSELHNDCMFFRQNHCLECCEMIKRNSPCDYDMIEELIMDGLDRGWEVASGNLQHYLLGNGETKIYDYNWLMDFNAFSSADEKLNNYFLEQPYNEFQDKYGFVGTLQDLLEYMYINQINRESIGYDELVYFESDAQGSEGTEYYYASGGSHIKGIAAYDIYRDGDQFIITGTIHKTWVDYYDWHPGLDGSGSYFYLGIMDDEELNCFAMNGDAAYFNMRSYYDTEFTIEYSRHDNLFGIYYTSDNESWEDIVVSPSEDELGDVTGAGEIYK